MTEELTPTNTGRGQVCMDDRFGLIYRSHSSRYFYIIGDDKRLFILKNIDKYTCLEKNSVPRSMIRRDSMAEHDTRVMCSGCGKMFKKIDMDGALCRGFDGCSVKKEIEDMRKDRCMCDARSFL